MKVKLIGGEHDGETHEIAGGSTYIAWPKAYKCSIGDKPRPLNIYRIERVWHDSGEVETFGRLVENPDV